MTLQPQFIVGEDIIRIPLSGEKLAKEVSDLNIINKFGNELYKKNINFIRENVPDTWFAAIEPISGTFVAANHPIKLYDYTSKNFPGKLIYVIGLLRNNVVNFVFDFDYA
jgi:hypothetical protein